MTLNPPTPYRTPITTSLLRGCIDVEQTDVGLIPHRLPLWARTQWTDQQLVMAESQPSGVRIRFRTAATIVELEALPTRRVYVGMPPRPAGSYDLMIDGSLVDQGGISSGHVIRIDLSRIGADGVPAIESIAGVPGRVVFANLPAGEKRMEIWLPHNEATLLIGLHSNAPVMPFGDGAERTWLHHGSSISQGSDAASPTGTWPAVAAGMAKVELLNLGFGGSALLDPFVARTIRDATADVVSLKLGINLVNTDLMRLRAFGPAVHGFLDTIREGHPNTPLLIISPLLCPIHEDVPGPSAPDFSDGSLKFRATGHPAEVAAGRLTLKVVRDALQKIVSQRRVVDPNIHYLDGRKLYGDDDHSRRPLPDRLHLDAETHRVVGERFAELAFGAAGPLG